MPEVEKVAIRSPLKWKHWEGASGTLCLGITTACAAPEVKGRYSIHGWRDDDGIGESYAAAYFPHYGLRWEELGKFGTLAEAKQRAEEHHQQRPVYDEKVRPKSQALEKALTRVRAAGYRVRPRVPEAKVKAPLGLNAVGKPYGANYDPNYKMSCTYGRPSGLRAPYGPNMRFVGDSRTTDKQPQPTPLNDPIQPERSSNNQNGAPRTYWLSFTNENECTGIVIVDVGSDEIGKAGAFFAAIRKSLQLKISPGPDHSVDGREIPPGAIPEEFKHRLLSRAEAEALNPKLQ